MTFAAAVNDLLYRGWTVQEVAADLDCTEAEVRDAIDPDFDNDPDPELVDRFAAKFAEIDLLCASVPNDLVPGEWRTRRGLEERRLIDQLYEQYREASLAERKALDAAHGAWHDCKQEEADLRLAEDIDRGVVIAPSGIARRVREVARRHHAARSTVAPTVTRTAPRPRTKRRPRGRRQRHVARATSSSDSGSDSPEGDGDPPPPVLRHALQLLKLALDQVRWCRGCHRFAFAIDRFERDQLDALGFGDGLCPDCRESEP